MYWITAFLNTFTHLVLHAHKDLHQVTKLESYWDAILAGMLLGGVWKSAHCMSTTARNPHGTSHCWLQAAVPLRTSSGGGMITGHLLGSGANRETPLATGLLKQHTRGYRMHNSLAHIQ